MSAISVEKTTVELMRITSPGLDPISVIFQDFEIGKGKVFIECCGRAWSAYWGAMGDSTIRQFFMLCGEYYLANCLMNGWSVGCDEKYVTRIVAAVREALE